MYRKDVVDRYLISGAFALLLFEAFVLLADLNLLPPCLMPSSQQQAVATQIIGKISSTKQQVRHRNQSSMLWEPSSIGDHLRGYDSVLTLGGSSARLELEGDINIDLQENTLIVVEPSEQVATGEFRLKFARGDLRTKANKQFQLATENWAINAQSGSDISLRQLEGGTLEVEVSKGQVNLINKQDPSSNQNFKQGQRLEVDSKTVKNVQTVSSELNWQTPQGQTLYTHENQAPFVLKWSGEAQSVRHLKSNQLQPKITVGNNQTQLAVDLEIGTHHFSLENNGAISSSLTVQVWPAQKLSYFSPLPRNRLKTGNHTTFSWSPLVAAKEYQLELSLTPDFSNTYVTQKTKFTQQELPVEDTGLFYWRVSGVDGDGYLIPPRFKNRFYSVEEPLAAPILRGPARSNEPDESQKLNHNENPTTPSSSKPEARHKPHRGQNVTTIAMNLLRWVWGQLIPSAEAADKKSSVVFSWLPVPGADYYTIEISSRPEFFNPEVISEVNTPRFVWSGFKPNLYYWRVAGGQKQGRMGLFSAPEKIDLTNLNKLSVEDKATGVHVTSEKPTPVATAPAVAKTPTPAPKKTSPKAPTPSRPATGQLGFHLPYMLHDIDNRENTSSSLSGFASFSASGAIQWPVRENEFIDFSVQYSALNWQPEFPEQVPFQENLQSWQLAAHILYGNTGSDLAFGPTAQHIMLPTRSALEAVTLKSLWTYGLGARWQVTYLPQIRSSHLLAINNGENTWHPTLENKIYYDLGQYQWGQLDLGLSFNTGFLFGPDSLTGYLGQSGFFIEASW